MSVSYRYANLTKREWFDVSALGGGSADRTLGMSLTARAFELLLVRDRGGGGDGAADRHRIGNPVEFGRWADDSIAIIGDTDDGWTRCRAEFADLYADLIPLVFRRDGFAALGDAADANDRLYVQLCHLVFTQQATQLEAAMVERFGRNYRRRYEAAYPKLMPFQQPRDLRAPTAG